MLAGQKALEEDEDAEEQVRTFSIMDLKPSDALDEHDHDG